jgi:glucokinase
MVLIGLDVGGTSIKGGIVDPATGDILFAEETQLPTSPTDRTPGLVLAQIDGLLARLLRAAGAHRADIVSLGVGCPGIVRNGVVHAAGNFPVWSNINLLTELRAIVSPHAMLAVVNDANAAALAELWVGVGAGRAISNIVLITLGTGVGVGAIINDVPLQRNIEGGHHLLHAGGRQCVCGQNGCFEAYCSATAIAARATEALARDHTHSVLRGLERPLTCADVFAEAHAKDAICASVVSGVAHDLAIGCLNIARILDPQVIVLAGGVSNVGPRLADLVNAELAKLWWAMDEPVPVFIATAGSRSGIVGAAASVRERPHSIA